MDRPQASEDADVTLGTGKTLPVSVVIPAFNRADLLPRALASVRAQSPAPGEIIVVDDHSEDGTGELAEQLGARVIRHVSNLGEGAARNTAIEAARHDWVALLDSDDEWTPGHLEHVYSLRDGHVLVGAATLARGASRFNNRVYGEPGPGAVVIASPPEIAYPVNRVPPSSALLLREAVLDAGAFDTSLKMCADIDMWIRMLERGTGVATPRIGSIYHVHEGQVSRDGAAMHRAYRAVLERYSDRPWWTSSMIRGYDGIIDWDDFRGAVASRRPLAATRAAARIATRPGRLRGVVAVLMWRARARRSATALRQA